MLKKINTKVQIHKNYSTRNKINKISKLKEELLLFQIEIVNGEGYGQGKKNNNGEGKRIIG